MWYKNTICLHPVQEFRHTKVKNVKYLLYLPEMAFLFIFDLECLALVSLESNGSISEDLLPTSIFIREILFEFR